MLKPVKTLLQTLEKVSGRIPKWTDALAATMTLSNLMDLGILAFFGKDVKDTQVKTILGDLDKQVAAMCKSLECVPLPRHSTVRAILREADQVHGRQNCQSGRAGAYPEVRR